MACQQKPHYNLEGQDLLLMDEPHCKIEHHYPQISALEDSLIQEGINRYLREATGLFKASAACLKDSLPSSIKSSYRVHSHLDTLLSIELRSDKLDPNTDSVWTTYYPLTIKFPEGYFYPLELALSESEWQEMQSKLKTWAANDPQNRQFNEASYVWGDSDLIPYCLSADSLVLFPGGEGESFSRQRMSIALSQLK